MKTHSLPHPLHHCHVHKIWSFINRTYSLLHFLALIFIFYYRTSYFLNKNNNLIITSSSLSWVIVFFAEIILSLLWILRQPIYWRPVTRTAYPERLPEDGQLPGVDVFICTADHEREPTFKVMNTVISAMALNYPAKKLSVYLSDDGGANVTLKGVKEAWIFATWWLPFVRKYDVKPPCPLAYFEKLEEVIDDGQSQEFLKDRKIVKEKYEVFKQRIQAIMNEGVFKIDAQTNPRDHPALMQVINGECIEKNDGKLVNQDHVHDEIPLLVYVAREKKPSHPHNFKAGALNVLLRVSSILSNSPQILVLDCDMYCSDTISARQAMCFFLDPNISPSLGWVQYPQKFHNINEIDIYDSQMRTVWLVYWRGADGIQGPVISGTNFYIKREALYGINVHNGNNLMELRDSFGSSNDFIMSISQNNKGGKEVSSALIQEAKFLASCTYENGTKWGDKIGFRYDSLVEDVMTGIYLQSKGWRSVFFNPTRPQFLGSATINLDVMLNQNVRWYSGILTVGLSKYCPLIYSPSRMLFLQKMFSTWIALFPIEVVADLFLAAIPSLCFLYGIPLYPKVSDPLFIAFAFVFISSHVKHLCEVYISGGNIRSWLNEHRIWMIKGVTCNLYGALDCIMNKLGFREASFIPTNKAEDDDKDKYYQQGKYDFRTSNMFLVPMVTFTITNLVCFVGGVAKVIIVTRNWNLMFCQVVYSLYLVIMSFPVIEGMVLRTDDARVPSSATFMSMVVSFILLVLGYFTTSL